MLLSLELNTDVLLLHVLLRTDDGLPAELAHLLALLADVEFLHLGDRPTRVEVGGAERSPRSSQLQGNAYRVAHPAQRPPAERLGLVLRRAGPRAARPRCAVSTKPLFGGTSTDAQGVTW
jgi:hypothetical protein